MQKTSTHDGYYLLFVVSWRENKIEGLNGPYCHQDKHTWRHEKDLHWSFRKFENYPGFVQLAAFDLLRARQSHEAIWLMCMLYRSLHLGK